MTKSIADTTKRQLAASVQPVVVLRIQSQVFGESVYRALRRFSVSGDAYLENKGQAPFKIKHFYAVVQRRKDGQLIQETEHLEDLQTRVLMPAESVEVRFDVTTSERLVSLDDVTVGAVLECSDLSELGVHTFSYHPEGGMRHSLTPPAEQDIWTGVRAALERIKHLGEWDGSPSPRSPKGRSAS